MNERLAGRARHAVYGSVIVLAVIVALDDTGVETREVIGSIVGAAFATVLAEVYADYLQRTIHDARHPTAAERAMALRDAAWGFFAAILPVVFFILAAAGAISQDAAFTGAVWTGIGVVGFYAFLANRVAGLSLLSSVLAGVGFAILGGILVALKALL